MTPKEIKPDLVPLEPIAICGMSVRLPGGLHTPQQLWDLLVAKGDARGKVPKSRYDASAYYSDTQKPGSIKTEYGYFLDESIDIASVDTSFFSMGKLEVERMDPQQRQMLEVPGSAWKMLEKRTGKDDQLAVTWAALVKISLNFTAKKPSSMASIE